MAGAKKAAHKGAPSDSPPEKSIDLTPLIAQLTPLERKALPHLKNGQLQSELARVADMKDVEVARALQWLENKGAVKTHEQVATEYALGANGLLALDKNMPEMRFLASAIKLGAGSKDVPWEKITEDAQLDRNEAGKSLAILREQKLITLDEKRNIRIAPSGVKIDTKHYSLYVTLQRIKKKEPVDDAAADIAALRARKEYLAVKERKDRRIALTPLGVSLTKVDLSKHTFAESLTREDLEAGTWKGKTYRAYDVAAPVPELNAGREHFVTEAIESVRRIWIEMGFSEMEGSMTQSAFWDLDALFVPQDHPAREVQDTFYLDDPAATDIEKDAFTRVRDVHETGGTTGSTGWRVKFSKMESEKTMLRTHTTVLSAQKLWDIRQGKALMPGKYFTVGKVFRNEKLDWKHLFEFHQVEGIVVDPDATFSQLIGYLRIFFAKMGYPEIRLRPHHFPYTEPSVEVDVWHPKRQQWIELGGAGVFRPEVVKTLTGEDIPVLAWGLGLERIIVDAFGFTDLRDLYRNDLAQLRSTKALLRTEGR